MKTEPVDAHQATVRELAREGGPLAANSAHATTSNPQWFVGGDVRRPRAARRVMQRRMIEEYLAERPGVACERRAIVLAGPPGAGKSSVLREVLGADQGKWLLVDADEFKRKLLDQAIKDGSYESFLKPAVVAERERAGERFFPLELSALVHEESSWLAKGVRAGAIERGDNLVIDSVLSSPVAALAVGEELEAAGYTVSVVDVEVPFEVSAARIAGRWRESYTAALAGGDELGGRWVPSEYARGVFDGPGGRARSQESARLLAESCPVVSSYLRYWTASLQAPRVTEVDLARREVGGPLLPGDAVRAVQVAQRVRPTPVARVHRGHTPGPHLGAGFER